jgi:GT2 family glycosyltransferase
VTITVVTPWWNHPELAPDYFTAVAAGKPDDLIVVDNGSDPELEFGTHRLDTNIGFVRACNHGLEQATTDAVVFLNNDIELLSEDWLDRIRQTVEPGVLVGPLRYDPHGGVDGALLPYIDGWCLAGMRDDLVELGGFDTAFNEPAYYSDNDLCLRARDRGMVLRDVRGGLFHKQNVTAGSRTDPQVVSVSEANRKLFTNRARLALA